MAHRREIGAPSAAAEITESRVSGSRGDVQNRRFNRGQDTKTPTLPERDQAHRGGNQIRREGLQIAKRGIVLGNVVPRREHAERHRIGGPVRQFQFGPSPSGSSKRSPNVERFGTALARRGEGGREFANVRQPARLGSSAMSLAEQ